MDHKRFMNALSIHTKKNEYLVNSTHTLLYSNCQKQVFSKTGGLLFERFEKVWVYSLVTNFNKSIGHNNLNYGFDFQYNWVNSTANEGTPDDMLMKVI